MNLHDDHYREIEKKRIEPIIEMEGDICDDIPLKYHAILRRNLNNVLAKKHELRLGHKDDQDKEIAKSANYRFRARWKRWIKDGDDPKAIPPRDSGELLAGLRCWVWSDYQGPASARIEVVEAYLPGATYPYRLWDRAEMHAQPVELGKPTA